MNEVSQKARRFEWISAASTAKIAAESTPSGDPIQKATAFEVSGKCYFKAAFQSNSRTEFVDLMRDSARYFATASTLYSSISSDGLARRAQARSFFANFWISEDFPRRKDLIRDCVSIGLDAKRTFEANNRTTEAVETSADCLIYFRESLNFASNWKDFNEQFHEALTVGREVEDQIERLADYDLAQEGLSVIVWLLSLEAQVLFDPKEFKTFENEARRVASLMSDLTTKIKTPFASCLEALSNGNVVFDFEGDYSRAMMLYETAAKEALKTGDSLLRGRILWLVAQVAFWLGTSKEDIESRRAALEKGVESAVASISLFESSRPTGDLAAAHASCSECHVELANQVETEASNKANHLRKAIEVSTEGIGYEIGTWAWNQVAHSQSKARYFLSRLVTPDEKRRLLIDALPTREETVRVADALFPNFWNRAVMRNYSALLKSEIASDEQDLDRRRTKLVEAVSDMEACLEIGKRWATSPGITRRLAQYSEWFGRILAELFRATGDPKVGQRAIKTFETSIEYLNQGGFLGAVGSVRWRIARVWDSLSDFETASEAFGIAAQDYRTGAFKVSGAAATYEELARYMEAWQHCEAARSSHDIGNYFKSEEEYAKSAEILRSTKTWEFLSQPFEAQSILEKGEAFSAEEKEDLASEAFRSAEAKFTEAGSRLQRDRPASAGTAEERELDEWLETLDGRDDYCHFRVLLEEARALKRKGQHAASGRKYRMASQGFKELKTMRDYPNSAELETLAMFCDGWGTMEEAESNPSAESYSKASHIFLQVTKLPVKRQFRLLALGNSSICSALETGVRFNQTRDTQSYGALKTSLQSAADYYREVGLTKTEGWIQATQQVFDALLYISQAESHEDPERKARLYHLAETHLEHAAISYENAGFVNEKTDVLLRLETTRERRQLLQAALQKLSKTPGVSGPGSALFPITLSRGKPSGLERFDEAFVVGELSFSQPYVILGASFVVELDIANVGGGTATLLKVQDAAPEGFLYEEDKNLFRIAEGYVNLAGKRLEHLQTFKLKIALTASSEGVYSIRPRVFFADDKGNYRSLTIPAASVTVLGIESAKDNSQALVGVVPEKIPLPSGLQFETERSKSVFNYLIREFLRDYITKRFNMESAGWRTLMQTVREVRIPKSSLYGAQGRVGPVLAELARRGLVETRVFSEQRGRGGTIRRVRVAYDNVIVRELVKQSMFTK